ncbi:class I SAM-dependent methyltransferase [Parasporobacterium paucivorans]|uniref:Methyltransferase domain-containing protein n=1 Tax=Parasporobacterium paucivorans DSM 15970 TaxID=1122934 RepID=A0A1M6HX06_9FIRM|nr:class I SAM-dependent methyltransferase [Parasporobacterium paucivorans]SHJ26790.1 Methyltransferase domain-containing protein [Parasporobacterium paucivorans DSM 15970]
MNSSKTINYYDENAEDFNAGTRNVDFQATQQRFLGKLVPGSTILDFGCGSGRDTKYFLEQGYRVTATDGSEELCRLASEHTGTEVKHMLFQDLEDIEIYEGIWACSSILHLPYAQLRDVLVKMARALKNGGIVYTSFKYGTFEGERNGRYFTDMTEEKFENLLQETKVFRLEDQWITSDVRPERGEEKWLNIILRKI